jgi:phenylacetyl-CoA:acceptor oxidoreductase subunit 2
MSAQFGPNPWQQTSWDWRAAGNFICGGAGSGLLITGVLLAPPDAASAEATRWLLLCGLALVGLGLFCVWLEIGRPLRALHVFFNPYTSWMSREAFVALLLFPAGLLALLGVAGALWATALLALAFLYCQSRMLPAARGIPAWRPRLLTPLMSITGLSEGCALFLMLGLFQVRLPNALLGLLALLLAARLLLWTLYRNAVHASLAPRARVALDRAGRWLLLLGTLAPLLLLGASVWLPGAQALLVGGAAAGAVLAGAYLKFTLITRASFNQGFALRKLPVRGVRTHP